MARSVDELEGSLLDPNAVTFGVETASLLEKAVPPVHTTIAYNKKLYHYTHLATTAFAVTDEFFHADVKQHDSSFSNTNATNILPLEYFEYSNVKYEESNNVHHNVIYHADKFYKDSFPNNECISLVGGDILEPRSVSHAILLSSSSISVKTRIGSDIGRLLAVEEQDKTIAVNRLVMSNPYHEKLRIDAADKIARQKERERHNFSLDNNWQLRCAEHASSISVKTKIGSDIGRLLAVEEQEKIKAVNRLILSNPYNVKLRFYATKRIARRKERERNKSLINLTMNTKDMVALV
mmetsp:Transcript_6516/g.12284  ORF Transcript_6516/g.12284 Transcript_6516/m.12284 type:complete len:294 (-) Transcript_6516:1369-2250(-)